MMTQSELYGDMQSAAEMTAPRYLPGDGGVTECEDQLFPRLSALSASITAATLGIDVTASEGAYFRPNDIIKIASTGEAMRVNSISTDELTVDARGLGSTSGATAASAAEVMIIGNSTAQGGTLGTRAVTERVSVYNYTQIFRHPLNPSGYEYVQDESLALAA